MLLHFFKIFGKNLQKRIQLSNNCKTITIIHQAYLPFAPGQFTKLKVEHNSDLKFSDYFKHLNAFSQNSKPNCDIQKCYIQYVLVKNLVIKVHLHMVAIQCILYTASQKLFEGPELELLTWNQADGATICAYSRKGCCGRIFILKFKSNSFFAKRNLAPPERPEKKCQDGGYELTLHILQCLTSSIFYLLLHNMVTIIHHVCSDKFKN